MSKSHKIMRKWLRLPGLFRLSLMDSEATVWSVEHQSHAALGPLGTAKRPTRRAPAKAGHDMARVVCCRDAGQIEPLPESTSAILVTRMDLVGGTDGA